MAEVCLKSILTLQTEYILLFDEQLNYIYKMKNAHIILDDVAKDKLIEQADNLIQLNVTYINNIHRIRK